MKVGLTLEEIQDVSGRFWGRPDRPGPGTYVWLAADSGELIYTGSAVDVVRRVRDQTRWATAEPIEDLDRPGTAAVPRLIARFRCIPYVAAASDHDRARDLEALIGAANVHVCGMPPLGWGLGWAPRSARALTAWDRALEWTQEKEARAA